MIKLATEVETKMVAVKGIDTGGDIHDRYNNYGTDVLRIGCDGWPGQHQDHQTEKRTRARSNHNRWLHISAHYSELRRKNIRGTR